MGQMLEEEVGVCCRRELEQFRDLRQREGRWQLGLVLVPGSAERDKGEPKCVRWSGVYCTVEG